MTSRHESRNYPYITDITADGLLEHVAIVIEGTFGRAHTYASENADVYRAQDNAIATAAKRVRALKGAYKLAPQSESGPFTPEELRMHPEVVERVLKLADKKYKDFTADDIKILMGFCVLHASHTYLRDARPA